MAKSMQPLQFLVQESEAVLPLQILHLLLTLSDH